MLRFHCFVCAVHHCQFLMDWPQILKMNSSTVKKEEKSIKITQKLICHSYRLPLSPPPPLHVECTMMSCVILNDIIWYVFLTPCSKAGCCVRIHTCGQWKYATSSQSRQHFYQVSQSQCFLHLLSVHVSLSLSLSLSSLSLSSLSSLSLSLYLRSPVLPSHNTQTHTHTLPHTKVQHTVYLLCLTPSDVFFRRFLVRRSPSLFTIDNYHSAPPEYYRKMA